MDWAPRVQFCVAVLQIPMRAWGAGLWRSGLSIWSGCGGRAAVRCPETAAMAVLTPPVPCIGREIEEDVLSCVAICAAQAAVFWAAAGQATVAAATAAAREAAARGATARRDGLASATYCPPLGAPSNCGPDKSLEEAAITLEDALFKIQFMAVQMVYDSPSHRPFAPRTAASTSLLQSFLMAVEALRLTACVWLFRRCWAASVLEAEGGALRSAVGGGTAAAEPGPAEWWALVGGLCLVLQGAAKVLLPPGAEATCPNPGPASIFEAFSLARGLLELFGGALRRVKLNREPLAEVRPAALYPSEPFGPFGACALNVEPQVNGSAGAEASWSTWDMSGLRMRHRTVRDVLAQVQSAGHNLSYRLVNFGAMDGRCIVGGPATDPANCLLEAASSGSSTPWGGIVVEASPPQALFQRFAGRADVVLVTSAIFPENASRALDHLGPVNVDLLKIDIDSFDCDVVATLLRTGPLARSPPKVLYVDFNPHIPPPFLYRTTAMAQARLVPFQGSSLQCFLEAAAEYTLLHVELFNAVFVRDDLVGIFPEVGRSTMDKPAAALERWRRGYFCHPLARTLWHRERDIRWLGTDPRVWADAGLSLGVRGESILGCLGRLRERNPDLQFSLTW